MKTLDEVKKYLSEKYGVGMDVPPPFSGFQAEDAIYEFMEENAELVLELQLKIGKGVNFREYFENIEKFKELRNMRKTNPDKFYDIIRKEELFLNYILQYSGVGNAMISFNIEKMFDALDDDE